MCELKYRYFLLGIVFLLCVLPFGDRRDVRGAQAQTATAELEWLTVDLWPDFDRPSVLVLLTGGLAAGAPLPAAVTVPAPSGATLNAVARITDENQMIDDIAFEREGDALTLTTPDRRFRVEYYMPYRLRGLQREFTFNWSGGPAVSQLDVSVQQPRAATMISTQPAADSVISGNDGLQYHNLPLGQLEAAEGFEIAVSYTMSAEQLTAAAGTDAGSAAASASETTPGALSDISWPPILAGAGIVLLLAAIGWQVFGSRLATQRASTPRKPRPARTTRRRKVQFCHQCGARAQEGDRFCRQCGTELKNT